MRTFFILSFAANLLLTLVSLFVLPDRVAIHYGADGMADGWGPNYVNALFMTGTHVLLFSLLYFAPRLVTWLPPRFVNLPNKSYWLSPENKTRAVEKIQPFMWLFGSGVFVFFFVLGLLSYHANLQTSARLNLRIFLPALGVFLACNAWWVYRFYRAFRIPGDRPCDKKRP